MLTGHFIGQRSYLLKSTHLISHRLIYFVLLPLLRGPADVQHWVCVTLPMHLKMYSRELVNYMSQIFSFLHICVTSSSHKYLSSHRLWSSKTWIYHYADSWYNPTTDKISKWVLCQRGRKTKTAKGDAINSVLLSPKKKKCSIKNFH